MNDLNPSSQDEYIGLANMLALLVGVNFLLMSILRLGFLINFLSRPVLRFLLYFILIIIYIVYYIFYFIFKLISI